MKVQMDMQRKFADVLMVMMFGDMQPRARHAIDHEALPS
jgi:hypothetical protein